MSVLTHIRRIYNLSYLCYYYLLDVPGVRFAKGCGIDSLGTQILIEKMYNLNAIVSRLLWIKASAKCINVDVQCVLCAFIGNELTCSLPSVHRGLLGSALRAFL